MSLALLLLTLAGCGTSRVIVVTGTTIGLKASPGDGNTRPPQVTFGYKRAEGSIVPTKGEAVDGTTTDAFSTLAAFHFETEFFGKTALDSFISTGNAAILIQQEPAFTNQILQVARVESFRFHNRTQRDTAIRITEAYRTIQDRGKRDQIRAKAVQLELVPSDTTDELFAKGTLVGSAVKGLSPVTDALKDLERFTANVMKP